MNPTKNSLAFLFVSRRFPVEPAEKTCLPHNLLNVRSSSGAKYREFYAILMRNLQKCMQRRIFSAFGRSFMLFETTWGILQPVSAGGACQIQFKGTQESRN